MNRLDAMTGLISYRLSKTVSNRPLPIRAMVRGVPIYIGADDSSLQQGATGIFDTGVLSNIPDAIQQTNADVETLRNEVYTTANFGGVQNKEAAEFYVNTIVPFLKDWNNFSYKHTHGWNKFADNWIILGGLSSWNSLNQYRQRLLDIRKASEGFISYKSPSPAGPSQNLAARAAADAQAAAKAMFGLVKVILIIAIIGLSIGLIMYGLPNVTVAAVP